MTAAMPAVVDLLGEARRGRSRRGRVAAAAQVQVAVDDAAGVRRRLRVARVVVSRAGGAEPASSVAEV